MKRKWYVTAIIAVLCVLLIPAKTYAAKKTITTINYVVDMNKIDLNVNWTEEQVTDRVRQNIATNTLGIYVDTDSNTGMSFQDPQTGGWVGADVNRSVRKDLVYYIKASTNLSSQEYDWPEEIKDGDDDYSGITIFLNGDNLTDKCSFTYNKFYNKLSVRFPIGIATTEGRVTSITISENLFMLLPAKQEAFLPMYTAQKKTKMLTGA